MCLFRFLPFYIREATYVKQELCWQMKLGWILKTSPMGFICELLSSSLQNRFTFYKLYELSQKQKHLNFQQEIKGKKRKEKDKELTKQ